MTRQYNVGKEEERKTSGLGAEGDIFPFRCGGSREEKESCEGIGWRQRALEWMFLKTFYYSHFNIIQEVVEKNSSLVTFGSLTVICMCPSPIAASADSTV